jgi:hypothetical protein
LFITVAHAYLSEEKWMSGEPSEGAKNKQARWFFLENAVLTFRCRVNLARNYSPNRRLV